MNTVNYQYQYDYIVFICRGEPFHIGHEMVIKKALTLAQRVIVLVGSSNQPRTIKNPFTFFEREEMIYNSFPAVTNSKDKNILQPARLICVPLRDYMYNDQKWTAEVQRNVENTMLLSGFSDYPKKVAIIGHTKDESSYYLKLFPTWELIEHEMNEVVNATDIRQLYFERSIKFIEGVVPISVYKFLEQFQKTNEYRELVEEWEFIKKYKKQWEATPYPVIFTTVDICVVCNGHVLLVRRKANPGKNLIAMPGGFVNQNEKLIDAAIRELREETNIRLKVPDPVLKGSVRDMHVFDAPNRSLRGRTITHAYLIVLDNQKGLPIVKGGDDASAAFWMPLSEVERTPEAFFEDHHDMLTYFLGQV